METRHQGKAGIFTKVDTGGAVFAPVHGKAAARVYQYGPPDAKERPTMFTCPVSAIPEEVFELLIVWQACRLTHSLPMAGGLLDQPVWVQRYFPILDAEQEKADARKGSSEQAAMVAAGTVMKMLQGGR